jgi:hypothetical protein
MTFRRERETDRERDENMDFGAELTKHTFPIGWISVPADVLLLLLLLCLFS